MHHWTKEKLSAYLKDRYGEQRRVFVAHLGGKCCKCNSMDGLIIDHVDPANKSFGISRLWGLDNIPMVFEELKKCQLLCSRCNLEKTRTDLSKISKDRNSIRIPDGHTHGSVYGWMKRKCKCEMCLSAKRAWNDERNKKRRTGAGYARRISKVDQMAG